MSTHPTFLIKENTALDKANTMALSCTASEVVSFTEESQITDFLNQWNKQVNPKPLFVLSGGSNVLLPHKLEACVLRPLLKGITKVNEDTDHVYIKVMAGENWHEFVMHSIAQGWYGLENLALIPGLVGASPVQNIGAYGIELCDVFDSLSAVNLTTGETKVFNKVACEFAYRDSVFKRNPNTWLISHVVFKLSKQPQLTLGYGDLATLAEELSETHKATPQSVANAVIQIRQSKLPDPKQIANTGSFFKNPVVEKTLFNSIQANFPDMPHYPQPSGHVKLAAGWLIDKAGLKGASLDNIGTHNKQALVVVNHAPYISKQADIAAFSQYIKKSVLEKFNINLEREPVWVNQDGSIN